jgi:hypothetical protein
MKKLLSALVAAGFLATSIGFAEAAPKKCADPKACRVEFHNCVKEKLGLKGITDKKQLREKFKAIKKDQRKKARGECGPAWRKCCKFEEPKAK